MIEIAKVWHDVEGEAPTRRLTTTEEYAKVLANLGDEAKNCESLPDIAKKPKRKPRPHPFSRERIVALMQALSYRKADLARAAGVEWCTVHRWVIGRDLPSKMAVSALEMLEKRTGLVRAVQPKEANLG